MKYSILTSANSRQAGGLFGAIAGLTREINLEENQVDLISYNDNYSNEDLLKYGNTTNHEYKISRLRLLAQFGYSSTLSSILERLHPALVDVQGIWMYHSWAALKYTNKHPNVKKVITPHGMLDSWALKNSAWKKKIVGKLFEYENLRTADCFHALCKSEYNSIREFGLTSPIAIIPNGIDLPNNIQLDKNKKKKVLLYIGRIHPKKGLKEMIEGVALLKQKNKSILDNWLIRVAGWDQNGHLDELNSLCKNIGLNNIINFIGPIFGEKKEQELCQADAFILPSFSEGLPMSILEAWAYKLPCIMTDYCNLPEGFETNAAFRIEPNAESIAVGLESMFNLSNSQRILMGSNGYKLCERQFTWKVISQQKLHLYRWLLGEAEKPDFVYE